MSDDWKEALPEGLRDAPFLGKAESLDDAVGKLQHAANHVGNSLRLPDQAASDEQMKEYRAKVMEKFPDLMERPSEENTDTILRQLGLPEKEEAYDALDGVDENRLAEIRAEAFQAGLTNAQFKKLYGSQVARQSAEAQQAANVHKESIERLQREWGETYNDRMAELKQLAKNTEAPEHIIKALQEDRISADDARWLSKWAKATQEAAVNTARDSTTNGRLTPEEAAAKFSDLQHDPAYFDVMDPKHQIVQRRAIELAQIAWPD